jgi:two-component system, NarL family, nitrate/nitrite response regulator NarL
MDTPVRSGPPESAPDTETRTFLVVDEHALIRHGFALSVAEILPDARPVEAGGIEEAIRLGRAAPRLALTLVDQRLALDQGGAGLRRLFEALGDRPVLVMSGTEETAAIVEAVRLGARGYLLKTSTREVLEHAISLALTGETYLPLPRSVLAGTARESGSRPPDEVLNRLTGRQRDVFQLLLSGRSNKEIARALGVLEGTVKVHVRAIMQKLGVRNRTQVAVLAARSRVFDEPADAGEPDAPRSTHPIRA